MIHVGECADCFGEWHYLCIFECRDCGRTYLPWKHGCNRGEIMFDCDCQYDHQWFDPKSTKRKLRKRLKLRF